MREPDRIIRLKTVLFRTGLSRSTIYRKIVEGTFPPQIRISIHGAGWHESTSTAGSPIRSHGVRKTSSMRSVEAVTDFEKAGTHAGDDEDPGASGPSQRRRSLKLHCFPLLRERRHGLLAEMGPERRHPVNAKPLSRWRFAPALTGCRRPGGG